MSGLRITATNTTISRIILAMSDNVPGAIDVLSQVATANPMLLLTLDLKGLYGSRIWEIYKDDCSQDLTKFMAHIKTLPSEH